MVAVQEIEHVNDKRCYLSIAPFMMKQGLTALAPAAKHTQQKTF
jgi:hypothetical protein